MTEALLFMFICCNRCMSESNDIQAECAKYVYINTRTHPIQLTNERPDLYKS